MKTYNPDEITAILDRLRKFFATQSVWKPEDVAHDLCIPVATLRSWLSRRSFPRGKKHTPAYLEAIERFLEGRVE